MKLIILAALILLLVLLLTYNMYPQTSLFGKQAPNFQLRDEAGAMHTLSELRGSKVALYFYPKDFTPGCTAQACDIRDNFAQLKEHGITILGLSPDSVASHHKFKEQYHLPFHVLSADKKVTKAYGVHGTLFTTRRTFLINEQGIIVGIITNVDTKHHAQQIIDGFSSLDTPIKI